MKATNKMQTASSGFTLTELLIVIVVISILASLILPALSRAKEKAMSIKCRNNLRQLGLQLLFYVNDHSAYPSDPWVTTNLVGKMKTYGTVIQGKEEQGVQRCPTRRYSFLNPSISFNGSPLPGNGTSYGYNAYGYIGINSPITGNLGLGGGTDGDSFKPLAEAEVLVPSEMIAIGDNFALLPRTGSYLPTDTVMESVAGLTRQEVSSDRSLDVRERVTKGAKRHNSRGNIVFSDGHIESLTFKDLFLSRDDHSLRRWNKDHQSHR